VARVEFPIDPGLIYLNHAAVGAMPTRTRSAVERFCLEACARPTRNYGLWLDAEARLRERLGRLLGVAPDTIALTKNTSEAISIVAQGLHWREGDNLVLPTGEFPSNRLPWQALREHGVEVREVPPGEGGDPAALLDACDDATRLVAASWVCYKTGKRLDIEALGSACRERDVLLFVDAIQGLGAVEFPPGCADFVAGGSHKWLLAPEGLGYLHVTPAQRDRLRLNQFGWRMLDRPFDFDRDDRGLAEGSRRFEPGTMNVMGIVGLEASLSLIEELTVPTVAEIVHARARHAMDLVDARPALSLVTPRSAHAGIVAAALAGGPERGPAIFRALLDHGVTVALRGGYLRFSPHFHTREAQLDEAFAILDRVLAGV
jgi:selenocysteine lyase/cysteine desulfurase